MIRWLRRLLGGKEESPSLPAARSRRSESGAFAEDNNDFGLATYGQLRHRPGNLFLSPFCMRAALGMSLAGARGETAAQMREALRIAFSDEALHAAFAEIIQRLNAGGGKYEVALANALWGQEGTPLQPGFLDLIARHYGGNMNLVDFRRGAEAARVTMNKWVEDQTGQKIRELIPPGGVSADTRLFLLNAVYFKGAWVLRFRREATHDAPFYSEDGGSVKAPLMQQQDKVRYLQASSYQAVDLDYRGGDLSMLVLLPEQRDGLRELEKTLSARKLRDCVANTRVREVKLFLPRFKITWGAVSMRDPLSALGMPHAFTRSEADFSGINGLEPPDEHALFISDVLHKAFVEVNEEGTEAAAATAVRKDEPTMSLVHSRPPPVPIFRADHPFLFAIRDRKSDAILFLGRVVDPTREN